VSPSDEITCRELVELVTDYLDGALPASHRVRFEEHLVYCPGCLHYLDQMRDTIRLTGALTEETMPDGARDRFLATFRSWRAEQA
jgi:anti-sigma factor RsiW